MKKLLILAYDFPPYVSVGGLRPYNWFKYLKEFGVEPIVITRQWDNEYGNELDYIAPSDSKETIIEKNQYGTIVRSPYKPNLSNRLLLNYGESKFRLIRKLITAYYEFAQFLYVIGPKKELYKTAKTYLKENKVDAIIATGEPFVLFSYASKLSKKFDIPWIADYRDPWSQNKNRSSNFLLKIRNNYFEKRIVSTSCCISTVSVFFQKQIEMNVKNKTIHILPNGYNPEIIDKLSTTPQKTNLLTISFVGTIYDWHPWRSFIKVFSSFIEQEDRRMQFHLYGINKQEEIEQFLQSFPKKTQTSIQIFPRMDNKELLQKITQENVTLLFNYYSIIGTKIFDYLGVKRKIILCYANDKEANALKEKHYNIEEIDGISKTLQADLIEETKSGIVVEDAAHLVQVLQDLWQEFQEKGKIECNSVGVERYSRKLQVKALAEVVKKV